MRLPKIFTPRRLTGFATGVAALATSFSLAAPASAQQLWADEFNSGSFNTTGDWSVYQPWQTLGRTQFGLAPSMGSQNGVSYARMPLRTYNDAFNASAPRTQGSEIFTKQFYKVGTGIEFESRVRGVNIPRGVVFGPYTYSEKGLWPNGYLKEEIDFEVVSNLGTNKFWSNIWNDWNSRYGSNDGVHNSDAIVTVAGMNYSDWTTYTTRWYPDRAEWYVNGVLARTSTSVVPDDPLSFHLNMWNPNSDWGMSYDPAMQATGNAAQNVQCFMDVDYVRVKKLPAPTKGTWGDGTGLTANFYPQPNFAGTPVTRVDPRLYHDWKTYSPDINIPNDNFTARWTGSIASPFTESVKLTLRADDGVRLYINNKLVIDSWIETAATDRTVTVAMQAGVKVPIKVEYFEAVGGASAMLSWSSPSMAKTVVPQCQLFPDGDSTPPALTIVSPGSGYAYKSTPAFGSVTDAGGVASVKATLQRASDGLYWNGTSWISTPVQLAATLSTINSNWKLPMDFLTHGRYTIAVIASDKAGNSASIPARDFWIDTIGPTSTISTPANGSTLTSLPAASGTAVDSGSTVSAVSVAMMRSRDGYWWNGSTFVSTYTEVKATVSGTNWKIYFPSPAAGSYVFWAQGYDKVGNIGPWVSSNFTIGSTAKAAAVTSGARGATPGSANGS
jgi:hypothetical protein